MLGFCSDYNPDVVAVQRFLSQCCYREEASVPILLSCRGLCPNVVVVQRPSVPILLLYRGPLSQSCCCTEASVPMLLLYRGLCPNTDVQRRLLSQYCCRAEASVSILLLCREALCPVVVVMQKPLSQSCCEGAPVPMFFVFGPNSIIGTVLPVLQGSLSQGSHHSLQLHHAAA
jgi:hypothetical protein